MEENREETQSAWNISQHLINHISLLLNGASLSYLGGQIQESYYNTEEIRTLISSFLSSGEEDKLDELGREICKLQRIYNQIGKRLESKSGIDYDQEDKINDKTKYFKAKSLHVVKVKRYRRMINELLGKYGLGMQSKQDASKMF